MKLVQVMIGVMVVIFLASIFLPMYMTSMTSANQTGWSATLTGMTNDYLPIIFGAGLIIFVITAVFINNRKGI